MMIKANVLNDVIEFLKKLNLLHHFISKDEVLNVREFPRYIRMLIDFGKCIQFGNYVFTKIYSEHKVAYVMSFYVNDEFICYESIFENGKTSEEILNILSRLENKLKLNLDEKIRELKGG